MFALGIVLAITALAARPVMADRISVQTRQVGQADDYKVRLSAALGLGKTKDPRAIAALARALADDADSTVRRVAALSLGNMITSTTPARVRRRAIAALEAAARGDADGKVQRNAERALARLGGDAGRDTAAATTSRRRRGSGGVYLAVGRPSDRTNELPRGAEREILAALRRALSENAPSFAHSDDIDELPSRDEMASMGAHGYYIGSTVSSLRVEMLGSQAEVRCSLSMRVSPWTGRDGNEKLVAGKAASASGNGRVIGDASRNGIMLSKRDCLLAVVEQITARQVVPFLKRTARGD